MAKRGARRCTPASSAFSSCKGVPALCQMGTCPGGPDRVGPTLPPPGALVRAFPLGTLPSLPGAALLGCWQQGERSRCAPSRVQAFCCLLLPHHCLLALSPHSDAQGCVPLPAAPQRQPILQCSARGLAAIPPWGGGALLPQQHSRVAFGLITASAFPSKGSEALGTPQDFLRCSKLPQL